LGKFVKYSPSAQHHEKRRQNTLEMATDKTNDG